MTLVAAPPAAPPAPPIADAIVFAPAWTPDLSIQRCRLEMRIGAQVTDQRVRAALIAAVTAVDREIAVWRVARQAEGADSLAAVDLGSVDGEPRSVLTWRRAVHCYAAADLAETHSDVSAAEPARMRNEERAHAAAELLRAATLAVRDLIGGARSRVRLV